jgi:hypothetical protein
MMIQKSPFSLLRSLIKGQDDSFFKNLTGVFCTVGGTLVSKGELKILKLEYVLYFWLFDIC